MELVTFARFEREQDNELPVTQQNRHRDWSRGPAIIARGVSCFFFLSLKTNYECSRRRGYDSFKTRKNLSHQ